MKAGEETEVGDVIRECAEHEAAALDKTISSYEAQLRELSAKCEAFEIALRGIATFPEPLTKESADLMAGLAKYVLSMSKTTP